MASQGDRASRLRLYGDIVDEIKQLRATEPRDKVIGTMSILSGFGLHLPTVDDSTSVPDLYVAATRMWLRHTNSLGLMYLAATGHSTDGLLSWAIDWNHPSIKRNHADVPASAIYSRDLISCKIGRNHPSAIKDSEMLRDWISLQRGFLPQIFNGDGTMRSATEHDEQTRGPFEFQLGVRGAIVDKVSTLVAGSCSTSAKYALVTWLQFLLEAQTPPRLPSAVQQVLALVNIITRNISHVPSHMAEAVITHKASLVDHKLASAPCDEEMRSKIDINVFINPNENPLVIVGKRDHVRATMEELLERTQNETVFMTDAGCLGLCFCETMQEGDIIAILMARCILFS